MAQVYVCLSTEFLKVLSPITRAEVPRAVEPAVPAPTSRGMRLGTDCCTWGVSESRLGGHALFAYYRWYNMHQDVKTEFFFRGSNLEIVKRTPV